MILACKYCSAPVDRKIAQDFAACFDCKRKRRNAYSRNYWREGRVKNDLRSLSLKERKRRYSEIDKQEEKRKEIKKIEKQFRRERELRMTEMRLEGKGLQEIAEAFSPVITRERVRQILAQVSRREGIHFKHKNMKSPRIETKCSKPMCGKNFFLIESKFKGHGKHACCISHGGRYFHPDGTKFTMKEIHHWQYHNLPGRKKRQNEASRKYHKREYAKKGAYYEHFKKYQSDYQKKKNQDPEYRKAQADKFRAYHSKKMKDPEYARKYKEKARLNHLKYRGTEKYKLRMREMYLKNKQNPAWVEKNRIKSREYALLRQSTVATENGSNKGIMDSITS